MTPELSRKVDRREIGEAPLAIAAEPVEREALARRFGIDAVERLEAHVSLEPVANGAILATGRLSARVVQACAVSGEPFDVEIDEPIALRFVPGPAAHRPDEEVELDADELDEIEFSGSAFDLGEAIAQSLALAIDPYAEGPNAERARREAGLLDEASAGPFAALAALKKAN